MVPRMLRGVREESESKWSGLRCPFGVQSKKVVFLVLDVYTGLVFCLHIYERNGIIVWTKLHTHYIENEER